MQRVSGHSEAISGKTDSHMPYKQTWDVFPRLWHYEVENNAASPPRTVARHTDARCQHANDILTVLSSGSASHSISVHLFSRRDTSGTARPIAPSLVLSLARPHESREFRTCCAQRVKRTAAPPPSLVAAPRGASFLGAGDNEELCGGCILHWHGVLFFKSYSSNCPRFQREREGICRRLACQGMLKRFPSAVDNHIRRPRTRGDPKKISVFKRNTQH